MNITQSTAQIRTTRDDLVTVYHNIATDDVGRLVAMMDGYQVGHPLVPVAQFKADALEGVLGTAALVLEAVYRELNIGEQGSVAHAYRARGNRSLSVGDVVRIGENRFACASFGWKQIEEPTWFALGVRRHGTTSRELALGCAGMTCRLR